MKRANGEGSCYFNESRGRFEYQISYTVPGSSVSKRKTFVSKISRNEAVHKAKAFLMQLKEEAKKEKAMTLGLWLDRWITNIQKTVKPKTLERYKSLINVNIKPYSLSDAVLTDITVIPFRSISTSSLSMVERLNKVFHPGV